MIGLEVTSFAVFAISMVPVVLVLFGIALTMPRTPEELLSDPGATTQLRAFVAAEQRRRSDQTEELDDESANIDRTNLALVAARESELSSAQRQSTSRMTMEKKLRYARWRIKPIHFRTIQFIVTVLAFLPAYTYCTIFIQGVVLLLTPLLVRATLDWAVKRRFQAFDKDYPVMLLQYVSLLKSGLGAISALESAAKGLDRHSLVRHEVNVLIERLRVGLTEEQAVSSFGEDIAHPELELFVQSLLLHRRVGGTLSSTLERLSRQVRKRQQFRKQAVAAVAMERSSIYMIALIMTGLMFYLSWKAPNLVYPAFTHEFGIKMFQGGLSLIALGFYWSTRVTDIRI